jgi:hypothetical protein
VAPATATLKPDMMKNSLFALPPLEAAEARAL